MSYNSLHNYYMLTFGLMQHHKYSLTEIEHMLPYERDLYVDLLLDYIEKKKNEQGNQL